MIEINLLPEEMRPKERATTPYSALVVGGGTATLAAAVLLGVFYFFTVRAIETEAKEVQAALKAQETDLKRAEALQRQQQEEIERKDLALKVKGQRALWSGVLDAAWSVLDELGGSWFLSLTLEELKPESGKKPAAGAGPRMGLSFEFAGSDFSDEATEYDRISERRLADFMEMLMEHPSIKGRYGLALGGWTGKTGEDTGAGRNSLVGVVQLVYQKTALSKAAPPAKAPAAAAKKKE